MTEGLPACEGAPATGNLGVRGTSGWREYDGTLIRATRQDPGSGIFVTAVQV
jgi:hypothetical protein